LIKKVKMIAKRIELTQTVEYDSGHTKRRKTDATSEAPIKRTWEYTNPLKLGPSDNQTYIKYETDLKFKLLTKYGT